MSPLAVGRSFGGLSAPPVTCPYRAEQATGLAGGYDFELNTFIVVEVYVCTYEEARLLIGADFRAVNTLSFENGKDRESSSATRGAIAAGNKRLVNYCEAMIEAITE